MALWQHQETPFTFQVLIDETDALKKAFQLIEEC